MGGVFFAQFSNPKSCHKNWWLGRVPTPISLYVAFRPAHIPCYIIYAQSAHEKLAAQTIYKKPEYWPNSTWVTILFSYEDPGLYRASVFPVTSCIRRLESKIRVATTMADVTTWQPVKPEGLAAAILGVTIFFTIICLIVVAFRIYLRLKLHLFGPEDWLICAGTVRSKAWKTIYLANNKQILNMVHNGFVIYGTFTGIGTYDARLSTPVMIEGAKVRHSLTTTFQLPTNFTFSSHRSQCSGSCFMFQDQLSSKLALSQLYFASQQARNLDTESHCGASSRCPLLPPWQLVRKSLCSRRWSRWLSG